MSFPRYAEYKDSGIEWLGDVPGHWQITALKHIASLKGRLGWQGLRSDEYTEDGPFLVTSEHFKNDRIDWDRCYHVSPDRYEMAPDIQLRNDDLLIMKDGAAMGKLAYVENIPGPACLNSHLLLFRPTSGKYLNKFLYYFLGSHGFAIYMLQERTGTTFFGISQQSIGNCFFALPPVNEQTAIAAFLDRETAKIDALVAEQEKLIALLTEKRQAVISHAVTKGLNPAAPIKDSGIEWLGEVPEHWRVVPMKYLVTLQSGGTPSKENETYWDGTLPWASAKDMKAEFLADTEDHITQYAVEQGAATLLDAGVVLVVVRGMILARTFPVALTRAPMAINQDLKAVVPGSDLKSEFVAWYLRGTADESLRRLDEAGHGTKALRMDAWTSLEIALPPLPEQSEIATFLDAETSRLDALTGEARRAIDLLKEHRSALISAAVTGKINVSQSLADNIIPFTPRQRRNLLAAEVVRRCHNDNTFGRTKAHKMFYLLNAHLGICEFDGRYERWIAGPYDAGMMNSVVSDLEGAEWFREVKDGERYFYRPLAKAAEVRTAFADAWNERKDEIGRFIDLFRPLDTQTSEVVATLYAAWNDFLLHGQAVDDAKLLAEVTTNWHESKKLIPQRAWKDGLRWMRQNGIVPTGTGSRTIQQMNLGL